MVSSIIGMLLLILYHCSYALRLLLAGVQTKSFETNFLEVKTIGQQEGGDKQMNKREEQADE